MVSKAHGEGQKEKCYGILPFPLTVPLGNQVTWPNPTSQACVLEIVCVCVWGVTLFSGVDRAEGYVYMRVYMCVYVSVCMCICECVVAEGCALSWPTQA